MAIIKKKSGTVVGMQLNSAIDSGDGTNGNKNSVPTLYTLATKITEDGKFKGLTVRQMIDKDRKALLKFIAKGYNFTKQSLAYAGIKKTLRDVKVVSDQIFDEDEILTKEKDKKKKASTSGKASSSSSSKKSQGASGSSTSAKAQPKKEMSSRMKKRIEDDLDYILKDPEEEPMEEVSLLGGLIDEVDDDGNLISKKKKK